MFIHLTNLYEGADFTNRIANGTRTSNHKILWEFTDGNSDLLSDTKTFQKELYNMTDKVHFVPEFLSSSFYSYYGDSDLWFPFGSFPTIEPRTSAWILRRLLSFAAFADDVGVIYTDNLFLDPVKLDCLWNTVQSYTTLVRRHLPSIWRLAQ